MSIAVHALYSTMTVVAVNAERKMNEVNANRSEMNATKNENRGESYESTTENRKRIIVMVRRSCQQDRMCQNGTKNVLHGESHQLYLVRNRKCLRI